MFNCFPEIEYFVLLTAKKPRAPKGAYQLAEKFPEGEIMTDLFKKQWRLGKAIGSGGFGLLYLGETDFFFM